MAPCGYLGSRESWRGRAKESAEGNPRKISNPAPSSRVGLAQAAVRSQLRRSERTWPARGKGRRELGIGGLRQAGLVKWVANQQQTGHPAKVKRKKTALV